jgi:hypothetical protein
MGIRKVVRGGLSALAVSLLLTTASFADTVVGSGTAAFRSWSATDLDQDGKPYWDNPSQDGSRKNVGYFLVNAPTAQLSGAPGPLPYWGKAYNSSADTGGTADPSLYFHRDEQFSIASLEMEVAAQYNVNAFGWYDIANPSVLHPLFLGPDSAPDTTTFSPSANYGFYLQAGNLGTYYTQSALNPHGDTSHQHFTVFEQSAATGAEVYWLGIEDQSLSALNGNEGRYGDFNDMLIRISAQVPSNEIVPEPSAGLLALFGTLFMAGVLRRRRK